MPHCCAPVGESNDHKYFVVIHNNCLIRLDVAIWRYNFSNANVIFNVDNAFCYLFCMSVVDHTKVGFRVWGGGGPQQGRVLGLGWWWTTPR